MGYMKSQLIDEMDDHEEFRLAFEIEPELPDETEAFTFTPTIQTYRSNNNAEPLPF